MNLYLLFKSLHIIAVISWMAGLLYLPRIFVYHAENNDEKKISDVFKIMEKKLYFFILENFLTKYKNNLDVIFFTYPTIDNYFNHFWMLALIIWLWVERY